MHTHKHTQNTQTNTHTHKHTYMNLHSTVLHIHRYDARITAMVSGCVFRCTHSAAQCRRTGKSGRYRRSGSISRRMRRNSEGQEEWKEAMMEILDNTPIVGKTIKFIFMSVLRTVC